MRLILDMPYHYVGYHGASDGDCRVRIYVSEGADVGANDLFDPMEPRTWSGDRLEYTDPVILITDEGNNKGTSVTNMIEYITADVLMLWHRDQYGCFKAPSSYVVIQENAPEDGVRNHADYSRVLFKNGVPQKTSRNCGFQMAWRWTLDGVEWKYLTEDEVLEILGEAFTRYPSLSHHHPIAEPVWARVKFGDSTGIER